MYVYNLLHTKILNYGGSNTIQGGNIHHGCTQWSKIELEMCWKYVLYAYTVKSTLLKSILYGYTLSGVLRGYEVAWFVKRASDPYWGLKNTKYAHSWGNLLKYAPI